MDARRRGVIARGQFYPHDLQSRLFKSKRLFIVIGKIGVLGAIQDVSPIRMFAVRGCRQIHARNEEGLPVEREQFLIDAQSKKKPLEPDHSLESLFQHFRRGHVVIASASYLGVEQASDQLLAAALDLLDFGVCDG